MINLKPASLKDTIFKTKKKLDNKLITESKSIPTISAEVLSISDSAYLCSLAAKTCYNFKVSEFYKENKAHIKRIMSFGHDSIIAHSNVEVLIKFTSYTDTFSTNQIFYCLPAMKFMNIAVLPFMYDLDSDEHSKYLLISGSARAYNYFICTYNEYYDGNVTVDEELYNIIKDVIYHSFEKELFVQCIDKKYLDINEFAYTAPISLPTVSDDVVEDLDLDEDNIKAIHQKPIVGKRVDILYRDDIVSLYKRLCDIQESTDHLTTLSRDILLKSVLDCSIVTMRIHDFSRVISQQINRHHCGISQKSQRYVDYSATSFIDPSEIKKDKYDVNKKYDIKFDSKPYKLTTKQLGDSITDIYHQVKEQGLLKEDARAFLPNNVETEAVYTFTYSDLLHFLKVRDDSAAQAEVQLIAKEIKTLLLQPFEYTDPSYEPEGSISNEFNSKYFLFIKNKFLQVW